MKELFKLISRTIGRHRKSQAAAFLGPLSPSEVSAQEFTQLILGKAPHLTLNKAHLDTRLDADIEQQVVILKALIPVIQTLSLEFQSKKQSLIQEVIEKDDNKDNMSARQSFLEKINEIQKIASHTVDLTKIQKLQQSSAPLPTPPPYHLLPTSCVYCEREKINKSTERAWNLFLSRKPKPIDKYNITAEHLNKGIKALFKAWHEKFDDTPEQTLRKDFISRLEASNWIGEMLYRWRSLDDKSPSSNPDLMSRQDVLLSIADMFQASYFEPLGIKVPITIAFQQADPEKTNTLAYYDTATGKTILKTVKNEYGVEPAKRSWIPAENKDNGWFVDISELSYSWSSQPAKVVTSLVEELRHKFDHEVCKKYLRREFDADSPWVAYAKPLVPQFAETPGANLYTTGTYYILNPLELAVEALTTESFNALMEQAKHSETAHQFIKSTRILEPSTQLVAPSQNEEADAPTVTICISASPLLPYVNIKLDYNS